MPSYTQKEQETKETTRDRECWFVFNDGKATQTGGGDYKVTVTSAPHNHTSRKDKETEKAAYTASIHQANSASLLCEGGSKLNCSQQNRRCHPYQTSHSHHRTPALRSLQRKACKALLEDCAAFSHVIPKLQRVSSSPCTTIV